MDSPSEHQNHATDTHPDLTEATLQDLVTNFMKERDYPTWFRGLSFSQMSAADSLLNSIRDDSEQNTTHRVREALQRLGIHPLVTPKKIKLTMHLSRGNDIAFLWFLMEMYYRGEDDKHGEYSINEQIVMSAISHLDAIPTLRELDRLLPKQPENPKPLKPKKVFKKRPPSLSPYLEKQVRPIPYGKSLTIRKANSAIRSEYEKYLDPNYIVPNESSRWFAYYKLSEDKRIAKGIVDDQLKALFSKEAAQIIKKTLCSHDAHKECMKEATARKVAVNRRDTCRKCFDVAGAVKEKTCRRITAELNDRIEEAEQDLQKATKPISETRKMCVPLCEQGVQEATSKASIMEEDENLDFGHADQGHIKRLYFHAPTHHTPFKFNYAEIFELGARNPIKELAHYNLGGCQGDLSVDHDERIREVCKDLWNTSVKEHECKNKLEKEAKSAKEELTYYNPYDRELMLNMLNDALKEIRKNKKYVLATFPDAHKTPFLKEFIKMRYGFVYTRQAKHKSFAQSKQVFHVLRRTKIEVKIPSPNDIAPKRIVTYACKDYIQKKTNYVKELYHHNFSVALMDHSRNYWGAVRPYQCANGPPRNVFFAYLPSREKDIHTFRPWKADEHIRAKEEWDKRQRIKRNKTFG